MSRFALLCVAALAFSSAATAHDGHGSTLPWEACAEAELGAACSFESGAHMLHVGTCRSMSGALMCVRNQPLRPAGSADEAWSTLTLAAGGAGAALLALGLLGVARRRWT